MQRNAHHHDHHYHKVELKDGIGYLGGKKIEKGEHLAVKFDDGHVVHGHVVTQCCHTDLHPKMFIPVEFHGKQPWILLDGMKARRI